MKSDHIFDKVPGDRESLLAEAGAWGVTIYGLARSVVDELETVAPWQSLYYPPEDHREFVSLLEGLIRVAEQVPNRVRQTILADGERLGFEPRTDDVGGHFDAILGMIDGDLTTLRGLLDKSMRTTMTASDRSVTAEIAADLKGKCCNSLMGVAARLVARGHWDGFNLEPLLFPEKAEELHRNQRLVDDLQEIVDLIRRLPEDVMFYSILEQWLACRRVDQYALADLVSLLGALGQVLKVKNRRALYSGDYHRILDRERLLNVRIGELLALHRITWCDSVDDDQSSVYSRLAQLTLEIVAIIDANALRSLIGEDRFIQLRSAAVAGVGGNSPEGIESAVSTPRKPLVKLLGDDDLLTFLELLLGNVLKRESLARTATSPQDDATNLALLADEPAAGSPPATTSQRSSIHRPSIPDESLGAPTTHEEQETAKRLLAALDGLCSDRNPGWESLSAIAGAENDPIQPATVREAQRFGWELAERLLPLLGGSDPMHEHEERLSLSCAKLIAGLPEAAQPNETLKEHAGVIAGQLDELRLYLEPRCATRAQTRAAE